LQFAIQFVNAWVQVNPGHPATSFKPLPASHYNVADLTSPQFSSLVLRKGSIGSLEDVPDSQRALVEKQLKDLNAAGQQTIICEYGPPNAQLVSDIEEVTFWYKTTPPDIMKLLTSTYSHPLRQLGRTSVSACPPGGAQLELEYRRRYD
jgi:hypothetical protein